MHEHGCCDSSVMHRCIPSGLCPQHFLGLSQSIFDIHCRRNAKREPRLEECPQKHYPQRSAQSLILWKQIVSRSTPAQRRTCQTKHLITCLLYDFRYITNLTQAIRYATLLHMCCHFLLQVSSLASEVLINHCFSK